MVLGSAYCSFTFCITNFQSYLAAACPIQKVYGRYQHISISLKPRSSRRAHWLLLHQICNLLSLCRLLTSTWYSSDLSSSVPVDSFCVAIGRCIYLRRYGHDLRRLFQLCSSSKCLPFFEHNTSINASTQMFTCIGSQYMVFIDPSHVWIASGSVDFRYYHIRCLLPDDATTFTAVASLCISFILAVDLNLPLYCTIVLSTSRLRHALAVAPSWSLQWATIHLWRLFTIVKISPQTEWSNQSVCHHFLRQWIWQLLPSSMIPLQSTSWL